MRDYIVNVTNDLISRNQFDIVSDRFRDGNSGGWNDFLTHLKIDLEAGDVRKMNPATLGRIMCQFEVGDVMAKNPAQQIRFTGDCEWMLRELVAFCLAYVIRDRLDYNTRSRPAHIPVYKRAGHAIINGRQVNRKDFLQKMDGIVREANKKVFGDDNPVRRTTQDLCGN